MVYNEGKPLDLSAGSWHGIEVGPPRPRGSQLEEDMWKELLKIFYGESTDV